MDINSVNHEGSHDHCWGPKLQQQQEWQVQKPWDWDGIGIYSSDKYERIPVAEWAGSEESFIGKEFFRVNGGSMDHVGSMSAVSEPVMVSNMTEVIGENHMGKSYSTNKSQLSLEEKIAPSSVIKSEGNGIKCWLVEETNSIGNGFLGTNAGYGAANVHYHGVEINGGISDKKGVKDVQGDSLTCLKLGKRQYFEDNSNLTKPLPVSFTVTNPGHVFKKPRSLMGSNTHPPRCQVEGCNIGLANAKDYHKRHKVCELHSKAPKVIVMGAEQRFCQQCSRFHSISEFDDAKRSCRRRLAGHNERRRKSSSDALANSTGQEEKRIMCITGERFPFARHSMAYPSPTCGHGALSLLSTQQPWANPSSCILSGDLSSRSSAALRELIAENRVQSLSRYSDDNRSQYQRGGRITRSMQPFSIQDEQQQQLQDQSVGNSRFMPGLRSLENPVKTSFDGDMELKKHGEVIGNNVVVRPTLDLMQHSNSLFALESSKNRSSSSSSSSEDCEIWKSWEGTQMA